MAAQGEVMAGVKPAGNEARPRRAPLSPELIAILAVGVALAGVMLTIMMVMMDAFARELGAVREDVRELRAGQVEVRDRMVRVESGTVSLARELEAVRAGQVEVRDRVVRVESGMVSLARELEAVRAGQVEVRDRVVRVESGTVSLARELEAVRAGQVALRSGQVALRSDQADLRSGQTDLRSGQAALRSGQADLRDRMARVEAKVDVLAGERGLERNAGAVE